VNIASDVSDEEEPEEGSNYLPPNGTTALAPVETEGVNDDEPPPHKLILIRQSNYLTVSLAEPMDDVRDVEAASRNPTSSSSGKFQNGPN